LAIAVAGTLVDADPAEARRAQAITKRHLQVTRDAGPRIKATKKPLVVKKPLVQKKVILKQPALQKKLIAKPPVKMPIVKGPPALKKAPPAILVKNRNPNLILGKVGIKGLPVHKAVAGTTMLRGRVGLTPDIRPKLSLVKPPKAAFAPRFAPFVQRHWKKAFVWVAVAGIGYLTIPEIYYDRFFGYVSVGDPDYDECIKLLSLAALEEEEEIVRVRKPMPASATYRYTAPAPVPAATSGASATGCSFDPFVERTWSRPHVWVQIPDVGNVTVPEDYYDRFVGFVSAQPVDYPAACTVLVEAAAMDTVTLATSGSVLQ
jgi:hypothetical protein